MLVMSAAEAAKRGCAACLAGEAVAIPGLANQTLGAASGHCRARSSAFSADR